MGTDLTPCGADCRPTPCRPYQRERVCGSRRNSSGGSQSARSSYGGESDSVCTLHSLLLRGSIPLVWPLQHLDLSGKQLACVPPSVWAATELLTLNLSNNQISELPEELGRCSALEVSGARNKETGAGNERFIASLNPVRLGQTLVLSANKIRDWPAGALTRVRMSLRHLAMTRNPLHPVS